MPESIDKEILKLVKNYCTPGLVSDLVRDLKRTELVEQQMTHKGKSGGKHRGWDLSSTTSLDLLITRCQATLSNEESLHVVLGIGDLFKRHGDLVRAEELFSTVVGQGRRSSQKRAVAEAYMKRGEVHGRQGRWRESMSDLSVSKQLYQELNAHESVGRVENILGTNYAEQGKLHQARQFFERALSVFERTDQTLMTGTVLMNLGIVSNMMGEHDLALAHYKRAQSHFEALGDLHRLGELHHNAGMSYLSKGRLTEARQEFDEGLELGTATGNVNLLGLARLGKANVYFRQRDAAMALKLITQAIDAFTTCNDRLSMADAYKLKGMIHRDLGTPDLAESYLQTSLRINLDLNNRLNAAETYFELGLLDKVRGNTADAVQTLERASGLFKRAGAGADVRRIEEELATLRKAQ
jgi:tetratricopeptide (TPR) repeat protein